jgi:hypothetical protein
VSAFIEQQALRLTLKHLGDAVAVKAVSHQSGWQVELYGIGIVRPLGLLFYDANGALLSNVDETVEQIFAAIRDSIEAFRTFASNMNKAVFLLCYGSLFAWLNNRTIIPKMICHQRYFVSNNRGEDGCNA